MAKGEFQTIPLGSKSAIAGSRLGAALGGGLERGMQQGSQVAFQQSLINKAVEGLQGARDPYSLAKGLAQLATVSPQAAQILGPQLMNQMQSKMVAGGQGMPGMQQGMQQPAQMGQPVQYGQSPFAPQQAVQQTMQPATQGQLASERLPQQQQGPTSGGILPTVLSQDQIRAQAAFDAQNYGVNPIDRQEQLLKQNEFAQQQLDKARLMAQQYTVTKNGIDPVATSEFMKVGQRHLNAPTIDDWFRNTKRDFDELQNQRAAIEKALVPGFFTGLFKGGKAREKSLAALEKPVKRLIELGHEQDVRGQLQNLGLSQAEEESIIHPLSKELRSKIDSLPSGAFKTGEASPTKVGAGIGALGGPLTTALGAMGGNLIETDQYEKTLQKEPEKIQKQNRMLADFFKKNITPNDSLAVIRNDLWKKGYDWRQIADAMQEAQQGDNPLRLTKAQENEEVEVYNQPPIQSLADIFSDFGRWIDYISGKK